jgi:hypothetical protein
VLGAVLSANASKIPGLALRNGYRLAWLTACLVALAATVIAAGYAMVEQRSRQVSRPTAAAVTN